MNKIEMISHIWRGQLDPFEPVQMAQGAQEGPQNGRFWSYLAIFANSGPSYLKLVGHCLNKVEHCIPHLGGGMDPFGHIKNCPVGEGKAAMAKYGQIWLKNGCFRGPLRPSRVILVGAKGSQWPPQMWATIFNHVQPVLNQFEAGRATYGRI